MAEMSSVGWFYHPFVCSPLASAIIFSANPIDLDKTNQRSQAE